MYIGSLVTSRPSKRTLPPSQSIRPMVIRKLVVLPAPLGPSRPTTSPWATSKSTPLTTWRRPYHFSNPRTSKSGMARSSLIAARQLSADPLHPLDIRPERDPGVAVERDVWTERDPMRPVDIERLPRDQLAGDLPRLPRRWRGVPEH